MIAINYLNIIKSTIFAAFLITAFGSSFINSKIDICSIKENKTTLYFGGFSNLPTTDFCVLYDGEIVRVSDQSFSIKDQMVASIKIIFVDPEKIKFSTEENTVVGLNIETNDYKCFELTPTQFPTPNSTNKNYASSWKISNKNLDGKIPFNSIVVPLNPNEVNIELKNITWRPNNLAIKLPIIKLNPKDSKNLKDSVVKGYLKTISLKPFHAKQKIKSVIRDAMKISMII